MTPSKKNARALLRMVLDDVVEEPLAPGDRFGDYEIIKLLGQGGTGLVYLARHVGVHPEVALKVLREGIDSARFRSGASAAAELQHPNIVDVYHVGTNAGRAFYTMRYAGDENIETVLSELRSSPTRVAQLLGKVARAVHYAHERGVLHRDLKPSNILIERRVDGFEPFVADFDLAKRLTSSKRANASAVIGTPDYMSPEQVVGQTLTPSTDVYSLGVVLYEILVQRTPFSSHEISDKLYQIETEAPPVPSSICTVDPDLEAICLRCLEKNPDDRYGSAEELAKELERVAERERIHSRRVSLFARSRSWLRWHPKFAFGLLALLVTVATCAFAKIQHNQRQQDALADLGNFASGQAGAVLFQLHQNAERLRELAADPSVLALLNEPLSDVASERLAEHAQGFDTLLVLGLDGFVRVHWPQPPPDRRGRNFGFRDYYKGAVALTRSALQTSYLARAALSESTGQVVFGYSVPMYPRERPAAILVGMHNVGSPFEAAGMVGRTDAAQRTVVLGPRDIDRGSRVFPSEFTFLVHPRLAVGQLRALPTAISKQLRTRFGAAAAPGEQFQMAYTSPLLMSDYDDPVDASGERWLVAFAPIGKTGYVVALQARQAPTPWAWALAAGLALATPVWALGWRRRRRFL